MERDYPRPSLLAVLGLILGMVSARAAGLENFAAPGVLLGLRAAGWTALGRTASARAFATLAIFAVLGALSQVLLNKTESEGRAAVAAMDGLGLSLVRLEGRVDGDPRVREDRVSIPIEGGMLLSRLGKQVINPAPVLLQGKALEHAPSPGDGIVALGRLVPVADNPPPGDYDLWLASQGVVAVFRAERWESQERPRRSPASRFHLAMRRTADWMEDRINAGLPAAQAALLDAIMLGRTAGLSSEQQTDFQRSGLIHLFSVSGLHAGLVAVLIGGFAGLIGFGPRLRAILVIGGLVAFASLTGMRSPVLRATLLAAVFVIQPLVKREVEPLAALSSVALILLVLRPRSLWQLDFQLSFLCALTLVFVIPGALTIEERLGPRLGWSLPARAVVSAAQVGFISVCIQAALAPLLAASFGEVSIIAPVTNMLVLPFAGIVMGTGFAAMLVSLAWPGAGELMLAALAWPLSGGETIAGLLADIPGASLSIPQPWPVWAAGLYYLALLGGGWLRLRPRMSPWDGLWPAARHAGLAALVAIWLPLLRPAAPELRVTFLDVGQGDSILVEAGDGDTMLVDTGPPREGATVRELRRRGIRRLDLLVLTHADADHVGETEEIVRQFHPSRICVGGSGSGSELWAGLRGAVKYFDVPVLELRRGASISLSPNVRADVLHPVEQFLEEGDERNDASVVLRISAGEVSFLLTG
ncbi:ComEC/Rec2 family competence protein, partial [Candidatus Poribacteria bacterium]|nr:ComEC/Rec2 family competence protein [Candidatus Poribacteria bacterium]